MEKKQNKAAALLQLESSIKNKTTEGNKDNNQNDAPISKTNDDDNDTSLDQPISYVGKKKFMDFFELNYTLKTGDLISVDKDIKQIINRLAANSKCSNMSLTSNIIKDWIENNKVEIEKYLREQSKLKF